MGRVGSALMSSGPVVQALENLNTSAAEASDMVDERKILNYVAGVGELQGVLCVQGTKPMLEGAEAEAVVEAERAVEAAGDTETVARADEVLTQAWTALKVSTDTYNQQLVQQHKDKFEKLDDSIRQFALGGMAQGAAPEAAGGQLLAPLSRIPISAG